MKLVIDASIFEKFQGLLLGIVVLKGVSNAGQTPAGVLEMISEAGVRIGTAFSGESLGSDARIASWRSAYTAFRGEPKKNRSSVENLYRLALSGKELRSINKLVDLYNYISLAHMLPVGGEDLDRVSGDIYLTFAAESEPPVLLLGDREAHSPHPGEVIYKDSISAICRRWNWREADRTKLTPETRNCILVLEGLPPVTAAEIQRAAGELASLVKENCGGTYDTFLLNADNPKACW